MFQGYAGDGKKNSNPDGYIDFHELRAGLLRMNMDPRIVDTMQIGDVFQMFARMEKKDHTAAPDDEAYELMIENVRKMNLPDVKLN